MIDHMANNDEYVKRCPNDSDFREMVFSGLTKGIYEPVAGQQEQVARRISLTAHSNLAA